MGRLREFAANLLPRSVLDGSWRHLRVYDERLLYQVWEQQHLRRLLAHCGADCVFDVGANQGQYARMLRSRAGFTGLIISFEPMPEALGVLREQARNDPLWLVEPLALAAANGVQQFNIMQAQQFSSLSPPRHDETQLFQGMNAVRRTVQVRTETLHTAYERLRKLHGFHRPFLKMDTQGYDVAIVRAARDIMPSFVGLQSELAVRRLYADSTDFREALTLYESCGFRLSAFVPNNAGHFPQLIETDCIMLRNDLAQETPISAPVL